MPKRIKQRWPDVNELAFDLVQRSTKTESAEPTRSEISRVMATLGRKGGKVGGKRRLVTMTAEQRKQVAIKAAKTRWQKKGNG